MALVSPSAAFTNTDAMTLSEVLNVESISGRHISPLQSSVKFLSLLRTPEVWTGEVAEKTKARRKRRRRKK